MTFYGISREADDNLYVRGEIIEVRRAFSLLSGDPEGEHSETGTTPSLADGNARLPEGEK